MVLAIILKIDGKTKIVNKWIEGYLRNYVSNQQHPWEKWLHLGEYHYNTSHKMSIGMPYLYALYGYGALHCRSSTFR